MDATLLEFAFQNTLTAFIIIAYLAYEIRYGRIDQFLSKVDIITDVIIDLSREVDGVDEAKVIEDLRNGEDTYRVKQTDD